MTDESKASERADAVAKTILDFLNETFVGKGLGAGTVLAGLAVALGKSIVAQAEDEDQARSGYKKLTQLVQVEAEMAIIQRDIAAAIKEKETMQ